MAFHALNPILNVKTKTTSIYEKRNAFHPLRYLGIRWLYH